MRNLPSVKFCTTCGGNLESQQSARRDEGRTPWIIPLNPVGILAILLLAVGLGYGLSRIIDQNGDSQSRSDPGQTLGNSSSTDTELPPEEPGGTESRTSPIQPAPSPSVLPLTAVSTGYFDARVPRDWVWKTRDQAVSSKRTTNVWEDRSDPLVDIQIDNQGATGSAPLDSLYLVRANATGIDGFREIGIRNTSLSGRPGARWVFDTSEDGVVLRKIDFFFTSCETDFAVLAAAPRALFPTYRETFREVAASVSAC